MLEGRCHTAESSKELAVEEHLAAQEKCRGTVSKAVLSEVHSFLLGTVPSAELSHAASHQHFYKGSSTAMTHFKKGIPLTHVQIIDS